MSCTGLIFKARSSSYIDKNKLSFNHRESLTLLKKKSCKCEECSMAIKFLQNYGEDLFDCVYWTKTIGVIDLQNDHEYRMKIDSWDCEDGACWIEEFHMEAV